MSDGNGSHRSKLRAAFLGDDAGERQFVEVDGHRFLMREPPVVVRAKFTEVLVVAEENGIDLQNLESTNFVQAARLLPDLLDVTVDLVIAMAYDSEPPHERVFTQEDKAELMSSHNPALLERLSAEALDLMSKAIGAGKKKSDTTLSTQSSEPLPSNSE